MALFKLPVTLPATSAAVPVGALPPCPNAEGRGVGWGHLAGAPGGDWPRTALAMPPKLAPKPELEWELPVPTALSTQSQVVDSESEDRLQLEATGTLP